MSLGKVVNADSRFPSNYADILVRVLEKAFGI
jgi:hypothetical protein